METPTPASDPDLFPGLPDSARLWSFGVSRPLQPEEKEHLLGAVDRFLEGWKAHGHPLAAARVWRHDRFLLVGVDERITPPSGCSIDALIRSLRGVEAELAVEIVGSAPMWYRTEGPGGEVRRVSRAEFRSLAQEGVVSPETIVFDPSLTRVGDLRAGKWEIPASESWHRRFFA